MYVHEFVINISNNFYQSHNFLYDIYKHIVTENSTNVYAKYKTVYAQFGHLYFLPMEVYVCLIAHFNEIRQIVQSCIVGFLQKYTFHVEKYFDNIYNQIIRKIYHI